MARWIRLCPLSGPAQPQKLYIRSSRVSREAGGIPLPFAVSPPGESRELPATISVCLHHLLRLELPQTVDALEALLFAHNDETYQPLLGEQCARVGQLYAELKRRAGAVTALLILQGGLRLLRYRASPVLAPLVFSWGRCDLSSSV